MNYAFAAVIGAGTVINPIIKVVTTVHTVQSDRSFALSYADSLAAQGDAAAADRLRQCVKKAGFETAPMQRCRDLADHLLFG